MSDNVKGHGFERFSRQTIEATAARMLTKFGRTVVRYPLAKYLNNFRIDLVLDVANVGQYGRTSGISDIPVESSV